MMSSLQVLNSILQSFSNLKLKSWDILEVSVGRSVTVDLQDMGGEVVDKRGAIYLQESDDKAGHGHMI